MSTRMLLVGLFATTFAAAALGAGCGGSESSSSSDVADAASDVTASDVSVADASGDDASSCVDADLKNLSVDDAALGDAGGSVGLCTSCAKTSCSALIDQCNADCDCRDAAVQFFNCVAGGGQLLGCGFSAFGTLGGTSAQVGQSLGLCVYAGCKDSCGLPDLDGGVDAPLD